MKKKLLLYGILILAFIILPLSTACNSSTMTSSQLNSAPAQSSQVPSQTTLTSSPVAQSPSVTSLTIAVNNPINSLDPASMNSYGDIMSNVCEPLVAVNTDGKFVPGICSWTVLNNGQTFEFKVNPGVKFSTGEPLTAQDIQFSFERTQKNNDQLGDTLRDFVDTKIINDTTIDFNFSKPNVLFMTQTAPGYIHIFSKSSYNQMGEDGFMNDPIGTGPYKIADWKLGQYIDLVPNEYYYGAKATYQKIRILAATDASTRVAMLKSGEADVITDTPWQDVPGLQNAGYSRSDIVTSQAYAIQFDLMNPNAPWANLKVRQAIDYALDKNGIINQLFNGVPKSLVLLAPNELGYDPSLKALPYDLDKAKQLMQEAGYPNGFDMPLYYTTMWGPGLKTLTEYVSNALETIGIHCKATDYEGLDFINFIRKCHNDPTMQAVFMSGPALQHNPDPVVGLQMYFLSNNPMGIYSNPDLDKIINQALVTVDNSQRAALIKQAEAIINSDLPVIPICQNVSVMMMKSNLSFTPTDAGIPGCGFYIKNLRVK